MGTIAEGLIGAATAGTPPMGASFDFECHGLGAARNWFFRHATMLLAWCDLSIVLWPWIAAEEVAQSQRGRAVLIEDAVNGIDDGGVDRGMTCGFVNR